MNSLKMKTSVIYGVAQMTLGTFMKGANSLYFRNYVDLIFEVVTQVVLMMALFGLMDLMIIVKWTTDWGAWHHEHGEIAPGVISAMITMFIKMGVKDEVGGGEPEADLFPGPPGDHGRR